MKAWVLTDENGRVTATAISGTLVYDPEESG